MNLPQAIRIDIFVLLWGILLSSSAAFFRDLPIFVGTLAGALLAVGNWFVLRHLSLKLVTPASQSKARYGVFLALKTFLMFGAVFVVLVALPVNTIAFVIGLSSLILGILTQAVHGFFSQQESETEGEI